MKMEAVKKSTTAEPLRASDSASDERSKSKKSGTRRNAPLGIQSKKTQFLHRGTPSGRSDRHSLANHHASSRKPRKSSTKGDASSKGVGLIGSKYPSQQHP